MGFGRAHLIIRVLSEVPCSLASLEPIGVVSKVLGEIGGMLEINRSDPRVARNYLEISQELL